MKKQSKKKSIKVIYKYEETPSSQEKLDDIFDYIFTKTVKEIKENDNYLACKKREDEIL